jgi:hypothetical protein
MAGWGLKRRSLVLAVGALSLLALLAGACGGEPSDGEIVDELVDQGLTEDQAECMVDELGDDAGRLFTADEDAITEEDGEKLFGAIFSCIDL